MSIGCEAGRLRREDSRNRKQQGKELEWTKSESKDTLSPVLPLQSEDLVEDSIIDAVTTSTVLTMKRSTGEGERDTQS